MGTTVVIISSVVILGGGYFYPITVQSGHGTYRFVITDRIRCEGGYINAKDFHAIVKNAKKVGGKVYRIG